MNETLLAQVTQPTPDPGPFADLVNRLMSVLAWGVPIAFVALLMGIGVWFAVAYLDTSKDESAPKKAFLWVLIGGGVASFAAVIVNWAYGGSA